MNLIIAGASRSGKTILKKQLCRESNFHYIPFDSIISTLEKLYPETGIKHLDENIEFSPKLAEFIKEFFSHVDYEDIDVVIDLYQLFPVDYYNALSESDIPIIYLGYPGISAEEKLAEIKKYSRIKDWTNEVSDKEMLEIINFWKSESRIMFDQCNEYNLPFYDTGTDFTGNINEAGKRLKKVLIPE